MTARELLRPTVPEDEGRLKLLWKTCFGDEDRYIDGFFARGYAPGQGLVLGKRRGNRLDAPALFPGNCGPGRDCGPHLVRLRLLYLPGRPEPGFGRRLLAWTEQQAVRQGKRGVVMVPGEPSLFDFYGTLGYQTCFSTREQVISRENPAEPAAPGDALRVGAVSTVAGRTAARPLVDALPRAERPLAGTALPGTAAAACTGSGTASPP